MSTGVQIADRLTPLTGLPRVTVDQTIRYLRLEGLVPTSGKGGGKSAVHYGRTHISNLLLALAAPLPAAGPALVRAWRAALSVNPENIRGSVLAARLLDPSMPETVHSFGTFLDVLVGCWAASPPVTPGVKMPNNPVQLWADPNLAISLSNNPLSVQVFGAGTALWFTAVGTPIPRVPMPRTVTIHLEVLQAAGDLARDTREGDQAAPTLFSVPQGRSTLAHQSDREADALPGNGNGTLPGVPSRQPRAERPADTSSGRRHSNPKGGETQRRTACGSSHRGIVPHAGASPP